MQVVVIRIDERHKAEACFVCLFWAGDNVSHRIHCPQVTSSISIFNAEGVSYQFTSLLFCFHFSRQRRPCNSLFPGSIFWFCKIWEVLFWRLRFLWRIAQLDEEYLCLRTPLSFFLFLLRLWFYFEFYYDLILL